MIVVDTSVWIRWFRGGDATLRANLDALLDDDRVAVPLPVRVELLSGASPRSVGRLSVLLDALPTWVPTDTCWRTIEGWVVAGALDGDRFGVGDLLVAGIAATHGAPVWSLDGDFVRMERRGWILRSAI